jgi:hypothetical protein
MKYYHSSFSNEAILAVVLFITVCSYILLVGYCVYNLECAVVQARNRADAILLVREMQADPNHDGPRFCTVLCC